MPASAWEEGRLDGKEGPARLLFGQMYEDVAIELNTFPPGGRIFTIASAGCTAMALSPRHEVVAVDINPVQLAYAAKRFTGAPPMRGAAERIMAIGRVMRPGVGWWPWRVREFLDMDNVVEQMEFWQRYLNTRLFRFALEMVFSQGVMRPFYSRTLLDVLPSHFGHVLRSRMERCFCRHPNRTNPYARALLLGEFPEISAPAEAKHIEVVNADALTYLEGVSPGSFDGFTLSNILDGAPVVYAKRLFAALRRAGKTNAMVILRSFREPAQEGLPTNLAAQDRSMLWGSVDVRGVQTDG